MGVLVLSRREGEKIFIGKPGVTTTFTGQIELTVVEIDRGKVRIGFDAPRQVGIYRDDINRDYPLPDSRLHNDAFATGDDALSPQELKALTGEGSNGPVDTN